MRRRRLNSSRTLTIASRLVLALVKRMASLSSLSGISTVVFMLLLSVTTESKSTVSRMSARRFRPLELGSVAHESWPRGCPPNPAVLLRNFGMLRGELRARGASCRARVGGLPKIGSSGACDFAENFEEWRARRESNPGLQVIERSNRLSTPEQQGVIKLPAARHQGEPGASLQYTNPLFASIRSSLKPIGTS